MPFQDRLIRLLREERAFGIIEALMAMLIMTLVLIALLGLLTVSAKAIAASKLSTIATQLANEYIESIRSMPYDEVVPGVIEENRVILGITFTIRTEIAWVDDSADGTGASDSDGPQDYKRVSILVSWVEKDRTRTASASTFVKSRPDRTEPPTVNFVFGNVDYNKTPPDGTIFGLDDSPYKEWFENGEIALRATGSDTDGDLISMRFYVSGITPEGGLYGFDPTGSYENDPICRWNPAAMNIDGNLFWGEGTHEVVVEAWDAQGNRDAKSIFWVIDLYPPLWKESEPADLSAVALGKDTIKLTWQKAWDGSDQVNLYKVHRKGPGEGAFSVIEPNLNAPGSVYENGGLTEWATYEYYLTALSVGGRESTMTSGAPVSATTMFGITGETFKEQGKRKVVLGWNPPPPGVTVSYFNIYRNGSLINWVVGNATSFTDDNNGAGLSAKTPYEYKVRAIDNSTGETREINQSISIFVTTGN